MVRWSKVIRQQTGGGHSVSVADLYPHTPPSSDPPSFRCHTDKEEQPERKWGSKETRGVQGNSRRGGLLDWKEKRTMSPGGDRTQSLMCLHIQRLQAWILSQLPLPNAEHSLTWGVSVLGVFLTLTGLFTEQGPISSHLLAVTAHMEEKITSPATTVSDIPPIKLKHTFLLFAQLTPFKC